MTEKVELIGLGELLWDCFPDRRRPGGAPANVAFHAQQLGLTTSVGTRVGADELGEELCKFLVAQGLKTDLVQRDARHQTGTVTVVPESGGGPKYTFLKNSAWDFLRFTPELSEAINSAKAICFGTLAQRCIDSRVTIQKCLRTAPADCLIVYDVNLRPPHFAKEWVAASLEHATIAKLNNDEVKALAAQFELSSADDVRFAKWMLDKHKKLTTVFVTRGANGCLAVTCDTVYELPGIPVQVVDTVGAGDAFTAAIIFGQLRNWPLERTLELANRFGALVASRAGATPDLRPELTKLKADLDWSFRTTPINL